MRLYLKSTRQRQKMIESHTYFGVGWGERGRERERERERKREGERLMKCVIVECGHIEGWNQHKKGGEKNHLRINRPCSEFRETASSFSLFTGNYGKTSVKNPVIFHTRILSSSAFSQSDYVILLASPPPPPPPHLLQRITFPSHSGQAICRLHPY